MSAAWSAPSFLRNELLWCMMHVSRAKELKSIVQ